MALSEEQEIRIRPRWAFFSICAIVAAAIVFNRLPHRVGVYDVSVRGIRFTPLLASGFRAYLPWLNLLWTIALLLECARLIRRRRTPGIRSMDLGLRLCGTALSFGMALDAGRIVVPEAASDVRSLLWLLGIALLVEPLGRAIFDGGLIIQATDHSMGATR